MRLRHAFGASYLALFALSGAYAVYRLVFHTAGSEFSGLPLLLVTQPWSFLTVSLERRFGSGLWYDPLSGRPLIYGLCAVLNLLPAALINAWLFYRLGRMFESRGGRADGP